MSNTFTSLAGVFWPHPLTWLSYHFPKVLFRTFTLTFKKEVAFVHENYQTAFPSSFHSMLFTKLYYLQQSAVTECPQIYKATYNKHYSRKSKRLGRGVRRGRDVSTKRKYQSNYLMACAPGRWDILVLRSIICTFRISATFWSSLIVREVLNSFSVTTWATY